MCHRRYSVALCCLDLIGHHHKRRGVLHFKILADLFRQDRWAERAKWLAVFYAAIQNVFHVATAGVGKDTSVAEGARAKLHAALKPTYNCAFANRLCRLLNQFVIAHMPVTASRFLNFSED